MSLERTLASIIPSMYHFGKALMTIVSSTNLAFNTEYCAHMHMRNGCMMFLTHKCLP